MPKDFITKEECEELQKRLEEVFKLNDEDKKRLERIKVEFIKGNFPKVTVTTGK